MVILLPLNQFHSVFLLHVRVPSIISFLFFLHHRHFYHSSNSIITDPATYRRFKQREIYTLDESIRIEQSAHPDILSEVKYFLNASNHRIQFVETETRQNEIELNPLVGGILAFFEAGQNLTVNIPNGLKSYYLRLRSSATLTDTDLDYIVTWTKATRLLIFDGDVAALGLYKRVEALRTIEDLRVLYLFLPRIALEHITFEPFFRNLERLQHIEFYFEESILLGEIEEFVDQQVIPDDFYRGPTISPQSVAFDKMIPIN